MHMVSWLSRIQPFALAAVVLAAGIALPSQDLPVEKQLPLALAQEAASAAIEKARKDGFKVTVTIVNRAGQVIVQLRDDGAAPHTADTSFRKAYTSASLRASTAELAQRVATTPGAAALKDITHVILLAGGLPIRVGSEVIGGIGVGGAPGGDKDEICGQAGLDRIAARLK